MMPLASTIAPQAPATTTTMAVSPVTDLTLNERVVALYASDMPARRRAGTTPDQVHAWIMQGAERLGSEELRLRAEYHYGHRLLECSRIVTPQVQARHEQRFPNRRRLHTAEQAAAGNILQDRMSEAARKRNMAAKVDGDCPCRGTGTVEFPNWDPDVAFGLVCPVHGATTIAEHRGMTA